MEYETKEERQVKIVHGSLSNSILRPLFIFMMAYQVTIGQFLPLLKQRESLFLSEILIDFPFGRTVAVIIAGIVIGSLLISLFIRPLQIPAAIGYSIVKVFIAYSLCNVDLWASFYFLGFALVGTTIAATTWRKGVLLSKMKWLGYYGTIRTN